METDHYTYRITWSEDDREWVALCVEFGSLSWLAASPEKALKGIRKVVADVVADMETTGETPPDPIATRRYSGRFQVRLPPEVHRQLVIEAAEQGISLNRLISSRLAAGG